MEKYEDDIIKVKVEKIERTYVLDNIGNRRMINRAFYFKYYREGQEDILVDEPNQLPPKEATPPILQNPVKPLETD
uniref:DUF223 domain-containing protein n=1 Tax=Caenorhabditis tropicalis TaxID=1561998 RepID=A0A1I7UEU8_9PELO